MDEKEPEATPPKKRRIKKGPRTASPQRYPHSFEVMGIGAFPFDMLRQDRCHPEREEDSHALALPRPGKHARRKVRLCLDAERYWEPNVAAWAKYGWVVTDHTIYKVTRRPRPLRNKTGPKGPRGWREVLEKEQQAERSYEEVSALRDLGLED